MTQAGSAIRLDPTAEAVQGRNTSILPSKLEVKLQSKLRQARVLDLRHLAKLGTVGAVAVRVKELCMVEDIEYLRSKFKARTFIDRNYLDSCEISFTDSRSATNRARGIANKTEDPGFTEN